MVSPGGRTGSTTVLNMVNAHPAFGLAGENGGQLETAMQLYTTAANQQEGSHAWLRGDVHPYDLLCDLAGWFEHVTPPALAAAQVSRSVGPSSGSSGSERARTVRGFKEIRWGKTDASALRFLNALFPCHRLVFSERTGDWDSKFNDGDKSEARLDHYRAYAKQQPAWHNWWIKLAPDGFDLESFNGMLQWFGEPKSGCHFDHVDTANINQSFHKGKGSGLTASECRLRLEN